MLTKAIALAAFLCAASASYAIDLLLVFTPSGEMEASQNVGEIDPAFHFNFSPLSMPPGSTGEIAEPIH